MPWCCAKRLAFPGERDATATTSASGTILNAIACRSDTNPLPMRPTRTFDMSHSKSGHGWNTDKSQSPAIRVSSGFHPWLDQGILSHGQLSRLDDAALQDSDEAVAVFQHADICQDVAVHDQCVRQLARFERAELVVAAEDLGA